VECSFLKIILVSVAVFWLTFQWLKPIRFSFRDAHLAPSFLLVLGIWASLLERVLFWFRGTENLTLWVPLVMALVSNFSERLVTHFLKAVATTGPIQTGHHISVRVLRRLPTVVLFLASLSSLIHYFWFGNPDEAFETFVSVLLVASPALFKISSVSRTLVERKFNFLWAWTYHVFILTGALLGIIPPIWASIFGALSPLPSIAARFIVRLDLEKLSR
jgi:hypothetical protein